MFTKEIERANSIVVIAECNYDSDVGVMRYCDELKAALAQNSMQGVSEALAKMGCDLEGKTSAEAFLAEIDSLANDIDDYWYNHRNDLRQGMVFQLTTGELVKLDRTVPGDGTRWYVDDWDNNWYTMATTVEPSDLRGLPLPEPQRTA